MRRADGFKWLLVLTAAAVCIFRVATCSHQDRPGEEKATVAPLAGGKVAAKAGKLELPPIPKMAGGSFDHGMLVLASPCTAGESILRRELWRQGMLIAVREEVGVDVHDEVANGPFDEALTEAKPEVMETPRSSESYGPLLLNTYKTFEIQRPMAYVYPGQYFGTKSLFKAGLWYSSERSDSSYLPMITYVEARSRDWLPAFLKAAGYASAGGAKGPEATLVDIQRWSQRLMSLDLFDQLVTLQEIHAHARNAVPDADLLLARGYANLGLLTSHLWTAASQAYTARSWLYAERAVERNPQSWEAAATKGYALALAGLYADGLVEIDRARNLPGGQVLPAWAAPIEPFCRYDATALRGLAEANGTAAGWAKLLRYIVLEPETNDGVVGRAGDEALKAAPTCFRVLDGLARRFPLDSNRSLRPLKVFCASAAAHVRLLGGLPVEIEKQVGELEAAADPPALTIAAIDDAMIAGRLASSTPQTRAASELGWVMREVAFACVFRRAEYLHASAHVDAGQAASEAATFMPLVLRSPLWYTIESYVTRREPLDLSYLLSMLPAHDSVPAISSLMDGNVADVPESRWMGLGDSIPLDQMRIATGWDITARSLDAVLPYGDMAATKKERDALLEACPFDPYAARALLSEEAEAYAARLAGWRKVEGDRPCYWAGIVQSAMDQHQFAAAREAIAGYMKVSPDGWGARQLAETYRIAGDGPGYTDALRRMTQTIKDDPDGAAWAEEALARHLLARDDAAAALPHAQEAAKGPDVSSLQVLAACDEKLGNFRDAGDILLHLAEDRGFGYAVDYYLWTKRTGQGDSTAAARMLSKVIDDNRNRYAANARLRKNETIQNEIFGRPKEFYLQGIGELLEGKVGNGETLLRSVADALQDDASSLHEMTFADAAGDMAGVKQYLAREVHLRPDNGFIPEMGNPWLPAIAWVLQQHAEGREVEVDTAAINAIERDAPPGVRTSVEYFAGMYLLNHGDRGEALAYLKRASQDGISGNWNAALAADVLRREMPKGVPAPAMPPHTDSVTVSCQVKGPAALHVTPTGIYFSSSALLIGNCTPLEAAIDGKPWQLLWGQPRTYTLDPTSNGWMVNIGKINFKLAEVLIRDQPEGKNQPELGSVDAAVSFGELVVQLHPAKPGTVWFSIKLMRDAAAPDAAQTALDRPRVAVDRPHLSFAEIEKNQHLPPDQLPIEARGDTRLHALVGRADIEGIRRFLLVEPNLEDRDITGNVPLHLATKREVAEMLLAKGATVDALNVKNQTPLHLAAYYGRDDVARILLEHGASMAIHDYKGNTPLHWAALRGRTVVVQLLLDRKADVNAVNTEGATPLKACTATEVRKLLQEAGGHE